MFVPSVLLVMATAEIHKKIKGSLWIRAGEKGIVAAFTGMMAIITFGMARSVLSDGVGALLAGAVFLLLRWGKLDTLWVVILGTAAYWLLQLYRGG